MTLRIEQIASYKGKDWWEWSVWLEGTKAELNAIDRVVYTLHATFADPIRTIKTRENGFRLNSAGWGEFRIYIEIIQREGKRIKRSHWLKLEYPKDSKQTGHAVKKSTGRTMVRSKAPEKPEVELGSKASQSVYISSSAADAEFARKLRDQLSEHGVKVYSAEDISAGLPWKQSIQKAIEGADATVFVVSGEPNLWLKLEMDYAKATKPNTVIPVLVGESTRAPTPLTDLQTVRVASQEDVGSAASEILKATSLFTK
jgi:transcription initiation factor IIF auxiliary subunit